MDTIETVQNLIAPYLDAHELELVDITYKREQEGMVLRLLVDTIDTASGITIDECEKLNNYLSELLDKENILDGAYLLEVSSPGLDRPLVKDRDFERAMDKTIEVTTYMPVDSKKTHEGKLIGMDKEKIIVEHSGVSTVIPRTSIARARLKIDL